MPNFNQKLIFGLLLFVLPFAHITAQDALPTGDILHEPIDFPISPVVNTQIENMDELNYFQVEFNSTDVLDFYYASIETTPPDYETQMRYFWTFGDGHVSYESNPVHHYAGIGTYEVTFQATPIYSPKPPPPLMKVNIATGGPLNGVLDVSSSAGELPWTAGRLSLKAEMLRNFRANFESSMIITYKNDGVEPDIDVNDFIQVYYDSEKVDAVAIYSFQNETVSAIGEVSTSSILDTELITDDHNMLTIPFFDLQPGETRRILVQFVSNNSSVTFDPEIYFGVNFGIEYLPEVPILQSSLRKSWDPNAKEAFEDYISPSDIPNSIMYRIFMENVGAGATSNINVLDRVHSVLNIDPDVHAIVRSKDDEIHWNYEPNLEDSNVNYFAPDLNLLGQTPESNIEDSKFWFDVVYQLDNSRLQDEILIGNGNCRNGIYSFGRNAQITFDDNDPINTNTPIIDVGCLEENTGHCLAIERIFPNPVNSTATIVYELDESLRRPLDAFAVSKLGEMTLIASNLSAERGEHRYSLDFTGLRPDVYQVILRNQYCSANVEGIIKK